MLNASYSFTNTGATAPVVLTGGITTGAEVQITYVDGLDYTNISLCCVNGLGYNTMEEDSTDTNGAPGDNVPTTPIYLQEVLGTFTDSLGIIVGTPLVVGDGTTVFVPAGATQLQLGINDTNYSDNGDNPGGPPLTFSVTAFEAVPEPSTLPLIGGAALLGMAVRGCKRVSA